MDQNSETPAATAGNVPNLLGQSFGDILEKLKERLAYTQLAEETLNGNARLVGITNPDVPLASMPDGNQRIAEELNHVLARHYATIRPEPGMGFYADFSAFKEQTAGKNAIPSNPIFVSDMLEAISYPSETVLAAVTQLVKNQDSLDDKTKKAFIQAMETSRYNQFYKKGTGTHPEEVEKDVKEMIKSAYGGPHTTYLEERKNLLLSYDPYDQIEASLIRLLAASRRTPRGDIEAFDDKARKRVVSNILALKGKSPFTYLVELAQFPVDKEGNRRPFPDNLKTAIQSESNRIGVYLHALKEMGEIQQESAGSLAQR